MLRLAVPSILANITIPLVGIVDVAICGHIADDAAIGGIAVGTMLFDLLYWNFGFLRVGTSGMTAQAYGRGGDDCPKILTQSLGLAAVASLLVLLIQWLFVTGVLALTPCSDEVASFARKYFFIRIWAAPATLSLMAFKGWFIGMQNTVVPMLTDLVVNIVNMVASYLLAVGLSCRALHLPALGAVGVAWGTLIAQYAGLLVACVALFSRYGDVVRRIRLKAYLRLNEMRRLVVLNANIFVRSLCFMVVYVGYTALMSRYGDTELAVSAIFMKIFMLFSYFIDGFAYAAEALVGKSGAVADGWRKTSEVRTTVRVLMVWTVLLGGVCTLLHVAFADQLVAFISPQESILAAAPQYYIFLYLMPILSAFAFMFDGVFFGATDGVSVRNCMIWAAVAFVVAYLLLAPSCAAVAIYVGYTAHLVVRSLYLLIKWMRIS